METVKFVKGRKEKAKPRKRGKENKQGKSKKKWFYLLSA
jgi:hypothetical protein